jgi:pyruvate,water dikinase
MSAREWVHVPGAEASPGVVELGGKGHNLARLLALAAAAADPSRPQFRVPRFVVVTANAFDRWVTGDRPWPASEEDAERRRREVAALVVPAELATALRDALAAQCLTAATVAVRSSAAAEDGATASFAGQFETVLGVPAADERALADALRAVWASAFLARAEAYRAGRAGGGGVRMAVVIQELVEPEVSGVAFSADPVTRDPGTAVVSAVYGLGEGLVSGELDADAYRVRFAAAGTPAVETTIAHKDRALRSAPGGPRAEPVAAERRDAPALTDPEALRVASCARVLADTLGAPQDIEWALLPGAPRELVLLQTRPITTLQAPARASTSPATPEPADRGERRLWDNSNIIESYSGVTTPLTFSFARRVYEDVYRQFCRLMGVSEPLLEANRRTFANMLGLVRGRVYYNLLNWYRTLGLLPGFAFNRGFMEKMMGVREALEDPPPPASAGGRLKDLVNLVRMVLRMIREAGRLKDEVPAFHARVEATLAPLASVRFETRSEDDLLATYRGLEESLLTRWRAPLVNDFFAMIFFGTLCRLIERWLPGAPPTLANDLLCGEGGIISTEPARRVMALARRVAESPSLAARFAGDTDPAAVLRGLGDDPAHVEFRRALDDYIERFGDRCLEELKLETVTLREDSAFLVQMIRSYAARGTVDPETQRAHEKSIRVAAETLVRSRLSGVRRVVFGWVLARARRRVRDRENLRFERTRVFGMVRRLFLALGARLAGRGRLGAPRDVFYLTIDELFADGEGTGATLDLARLATARRAEFEAFARAPAPPDRFETWGTPALAFGAEGHAGAAVAASTPGTGARELKGTGCCPGVVRERVCIVRDPREAHGVTGRILVAERTDPGWTLLFPAARGLLVQRGSLLSHSAIVAREMGLPCVVGVPGLLDTLREGELVEMDGASGSIVRLEFEGAAR